MGTVLPQSVLAASPATAARTAPQVAVIDVALGQGGALRGQLVDAQGAPLSGATVSVQQNGREVTSTATDGQGNFAVSGLRGGVYQVATANSAGVYRLWAADTAPPAAQQQALLVSGGDAVRGQSQAARFFTNPWVLAGLVGAAIAIPIAVSNSDRSSS
jgi:hypothetical protein